MQFWIPIVSAVSLTILIASGGLLIHSLRGLSALSKSFATQPAESEAQPLAHAKSLLRRIRSACTVAAISWLVAVIAATVATRSLNLSGDLRTAIRAAFPFISLLPPFAFYTLWANAATKVEHWVKHQCVGGKTPPFLLPFILILSIPLVALALIQFSGLSGPGLLALAGFALAILWQQMAWPYLITRLSPARTRNSSELRERLCELARVGDINLDQILVIEEEPEAEQAQEDDEPLALVMGYGRSRRIMISSSLLSALTTDQVVAVVAHEVAHIVEHHLLKRTLILVVVFAPVIFTGSGSGAAGLASILCFLFSRWYERQNEFRADKIGAELSNPRDLAGALEILPEPAPPAWMPAPLARALATHPQSTQRIRRLDSNSKSR